MVNIRETVDSPCWDGADTPIKSIISKKFRDRDVSLDKGQKGCFLVQRFPAASSPGSFRVGGEKKRASYLLSAHARKLPRFRIPLHAL